MARRRIIRVGRIIGHFNTGYDPELAAYEAAARRGEDWMYRLRQGVPSPLEMERAADAFLEEMLAGVK